jgi:hypothetical protein
MPRRGPESLYLHRNRKLTAELKATGKDFDAFDMISAFVV